ncbi:recombinase family protein [Streptomyces sp. MN03-5084-2B]|nr:recombinase family protein [Streptomyces sp. MN03-5084-2B]
MSVYPELQELADWLKTAPVIAPPALPPLVYGYVRTAEPEPDYANACSDLLTWWSASRGWHLGVVFRDVGVGSGEAVRPGFTGLLDVLRLPEAAFAVIVETKQLGRRPEDVARMMAQIQRTGASVRVLADELAGAAS